MLNILISITSVYLFIVIGFIAKKHLKERLNEKTLVLISLYYLQPILTFWGLNRKEINSELITSPLLYLIVIFVSLSIFYFLSKILLYDKKDRSIFLATSLVGNTANLGIPLGIAIFGEESVAYTSLINIANVFYIYTISIYFFARGEYHFKEAIKNILKIPIIWFAIFAILYNLSDLPINKNFDKILEMGAYATIVIQLMIFGIYLSSIKLREFNLRLTYSLIFAKLILLPFIGFIIILSLGYNNFVGAVVMLELMVPMAVNNVNISALYNAKPLDVTGAVLITTLIFLFFIFIDIWIMEKFFTF